jgi:hypothetical protein
MLQLFSQFKRETKRGLLQRVEKGKLEIESPSGKSKLFSPWSWRAETFRDSCPHAWHAMYFFFSNSSKSFPVFSAPEVGTLKA